MTEATITGIATILSSVLTIIVTKYLESDKYINAGKAMKEAVRGNWKGIFNQTLDDQNITVPIDFNLKVSSWGSITGKAKIIFNNELIHFNIRGGFYLRHFLKMNYENADRSVTQFGSFVFKLSDTSKKLTGHFVGYGHISGKVISGPAVLEKN